MESRYSLRLYDTELMRFVMEKRGLAGLVAGIVSIWIWSAAAKESFAGWSGG